MTTADMSLSGAPIRVLMIGAYPDSPDRIDGGVAAAIMYLSQALVARSGIELIGARISLTGDETCEDHSLGWPVADISLGRGSLTTLYRRQKHRLGQLTKRYEPHVDHGQGADHAGYLAVGSGRRSVVTVHGLLSQNAKYQTDPANRIRAALAALFTERRTIRRATDLIAISPYVAGYYRTDIKGRLHDIPNAVAPSFFGVVRRPERGRLLYAGRIANGKGLPELLQAVARYRSSIAKLVLAGATPDSTYGSRLRREAEKLGLSHCIEFAGLLAEPQLLEEFGRAEALVLPSHQETAPMVVQQAMAAGMSVVATTVGGIPYQIQHDVTGLLHEPGNVEQLSELIGRLANDPALSRRLGEAAKSVAVRRYQARAVADATIDVYRTMIGHAPRSVVAGRSP
jgi:glycosyltransferase involved in cell wall biosynthesis